MSIYSALMEKLFPLHMAVLVQVVIFLVLPLMEMSGTVTSSQVIGRLSPIR